MGSMTFAVRMIVGSQKRVDGGNQEGIHTSGSTSSLPPPWRLI